MIPSPLKIHSHFPRGGGMPLPETYLCGVSTFATKPLLSVPNHRLGREGNIFLVSRAWAVETGSAGVGEGWRG